MNFHKVITIHQKFHKIFTNLYYFEEKLINSDN